MWTQQVPRCMLLEISHKICYNMFFFSKEDFRGCGPSKYLDACSWKSATKSATICFFSQRRISEDFACISLSKLCLIKLYLPHYLLNYIIHCLFVVVLKFLISPHLFQLNKDSLGRTESVWVGVRGFTYSL